MVEDQVQCFSELAARIREHGHLVVLARDVPLREALVVIINVLRRRPGAHDGRVVDGRDDDFVDVFLRERLGCREVARDVLRGSGGREGARQPQKDDAAALAALREVHRPARKKNDSRAEHRRSEASTRRSFTDAEAALGAGKADVQVDRRRLIAERCKSAAAAEHRRAAQSRTGKHGARTSPIKSRQPREPLNGCGLGEWKRPSHPSVDPYNALSKQC